MTRNQILLSRMIAIQVIMKARQAGLPSAHERALSALSEAIESKKQDLQKIVVEGRVDSPDYRVVTDQIRQWAAALAANR